MKVGRPMKWKTAKQLEQQAESYFEETPFEEWTITGLALHLGTTRYTLCDYENKPEFSNTVKLLKHQVEHSYEVGLRKRGNAGDIFAMKNFGWRDKQEIDINDVSEQTEEQLQEKLQRLLHQK
jgi:hypothetical protein